MVSKFEENLAKSDFDSAAKYCQATCMGKLEATLGDISPHPENLLVIAADTIVEIDGKVLEKPESDEDSFNMLKRMNNR